ncbi:uncharacterized protein [Aristolochia californica]|uniref:uncharacterized protein n=1 Tax=Aristolochia californica TaxID=171875 RepID=UPI0035D7B064
MAILISSSPNIDLRRSYVHESRLHEHKYSALKFLGFVANKITRRDPGYTATKLKYSFSTVTCALSQNILLPFVKERAFASGPSYKMVSDGYVRRGRSKSKIYERLDTCLVIPPTNGKKPRAIIKFLGGAFVGAAPEATYSHLISLLAKEGFLIVSVPYGVTFDHAQATKEVFERFHACMDMLYTCGLPHANIRPDDLIHLPFYSVGHSNGALLQLLTGSYFTEKIPKANVIISFNNRPASEAVPYFEQFGPVVSQMMPIVEASPFYEIARSTSGDAWKAIFDTAGALIQQYDQEALVSLTKFLDQLPSVMSQVTKGVSEFKPTPSENRDCFKCSYNVPYTLLVKFNFDNIDQTDMMEEILKPRVESIGGTLKKVSLPGNHLTPCIQDIQWQVGDVYTPADAVAQVLKTLTLNDTKVLATIVVNWLSELENR